MVGTWPVRCAFPCKSISVRYWAAHAAGRVPARTHEPVSWLRNRRRDPRLVCAPDSMLRENSSWRSAKNLPSVPV